MIHAKSLTRRLAAVPWLLAACLLVWAGSAQALHPKQAGRLKVQAVSSEDIRLTLDQTEVNEGADGAVPIVVTATRYEGGAAISADKAKADYDFVTYVTLNACEDQGAASGTTQLVLSMSFSGGCTSMSSRFQSLPILEIGKKAVSGTVTIKFVPTDDDPEEDYWTSFGADGFDEGRGSDADDGYAPQIANDAFNMTLRAWEKLAANNMDDGAEKTAAQTAANEKTIETASWITRWAIRLARSVGATVTDLPADDDTQTQVNRIDAVNTAITAITLTADPHGTYAVSLLAAAQLVVAQAVAIVAETSGDTALDDEARNAANAAIDAANAVGAGLTRFANNSTADVAAAQEAATGALQAAVKYEEDDDDLRVWITGSAGTNDITPAYFMLRDNDRANEAITFRFDSNHSISRESDEVTIEVTASLDAKPASEALTFTFKDVTLDDFSTSAAPGPTPANLEKIDGDKEDAEGFVALGTADRIAARDAYYSFKGPTDGRIIIPKDKRVSAAVKIKIDPRNIDLPHEIDNTPGGSSFIALGSEDRVMLDGRALKIIPAFIELTTTKKTKIASIKEVSPPIYEHLGDNQEAKVEVTLENPADSRVMVTLWVAEIPGKGNRDSDYEADLDPGTKRLFIEEGDKSGTATVFVSPDDNDKENDWQFEVHAQVEGRTDRSAAENPAVISIVDDDKAFTMIDLRATLGEDLDSSPPSIKDIDGATSIRIWAYAKGKASDKEVHIPLTNTAGSAIRDTDYTAEFVTLTIPAGETKAWKEITITPEDDLDTDVETIVVGAVGAVDGDNRKIPIDDPKIVVTPATINLAPATAPPKDPPKEVPIVELPDDADLMIAGTVGEALSKELPAAKTKEADAKVTYLLTGLPAGLSFDAASRTISGTPSAAGKSSVEYFAIVGANADSSTYTITISEVPIPEVKLARLQTSHTSVRESDGQATTIVLTVTLAQAAATEQRVSLSITAPREGIAAIRDEDFDAVLDFGNAEGKIIIAQGANKGTATLSLTPKDNTTADGHKVFDVTATSSSGHMAYVAIGISDNESDSSGIVLSVSPEKVSEGKTTQVIVTASLDGKARASDVMVDIGISSESSAARDVDYSASFDPQARITISAGSVSGTTAVNINAVADADAAEGAGDDHPHRHGYGLDHGLRLPSR